MHKLQFNLMDISPYHNSCHVPLLNELWFWIRIYWRKIKVVGRITSAYQSPEQAACLDTIVTSTNLWNCPIYFCQIPIISHSSGSESLYLQFGIPISLTGLSDILVYGLMVSTWDFCLMVLDAFSPTRIQVRWRSLNVLDLDPHRSSWKAT